MPEQNTCHHTRHHQITQNIGIIRKASDAVFDLRQITDLAYPSDRRNDLDDSDTYDAKEHDLWCHLASQEAINRPHHHEHLQNNPVVHPEKLNIAGDKTTCHARP